MSTGAAAGATVIYCDGHRCHALRQRSRPGGPEDPADYVGALREAVRSSRNGVLIRAGCLGACHRAPALLLLTGPAVGGRPALIGPIEAPHDLQAVVDLIRGSDLRPR
ncbi:MULTISPECIES: hypothetical protein [unclassified Micromonospora]|uniref:hypothetical protein n=1 Tax=unclassified Micromonospora TaxID=2617518 RepID=UPI001C24E0CF|nr:MULTISPECIES: hypothetical protein [unclassified Micromonospora]MBU8861556.1 hypothetical protein [Micromonospora sp. WMMB482]MDM4781124.1 hypothetical protein [Micromonospora sp. b486]